MGLQNQIQQEADIDEIPTRLRKSRLLHLIDESLQLEQEDARSAGAVGYLARTLTQVNLPHSDPCVWLDGIATRESVYYQRTSGNLTISVRGHVKYGIPFGSRPRILLGWICSEAVRTNSKELFLGKNQKAFFEKIGSHYNGRDLEQYKRQWLALARSLISIDGENDPNGSFFEDIKIASKGFTFWNKRETEQQNSWESVMILSDEFFNAIMTSPVPIDLRAYHALSKSPLAMDIYAWLPYRMFLLRHSGRNQVKIPWTGIKNQLGADYQDSEKGLYNFRDRFLARLKEVLLFYRVSELCATRLSDLSLDTARIWVRRVKGSLSTEHPIDGDEIRAIKRYLATRNLNVPWLFISERNAPLTRQAVNYIIGQAGKRAGLKVHPHVLREPLIYSSLKPRILPHGKILSN